MRAAVAAALRERQVLVAVEVVDALRGELADALGQPVRVVGHLDALRDLVLRRLAVCSTGLLALDQRPLERLLVP
jgi:hypothetical protein